MAAPYNPPVKNEEFIFRIALRSVAAPSGFQVNPTIASGDWKVDKDGGGLNNLGTLPAVDPAGSIWVKVTLSATEMNADVVSIQGIDQTATKEWADAAVCIPTTV